MRKSDLITEVAGVTELAKATVARVLDAATEAMRRDLDVQGKTTLDGIGTLRVKKVAERNGRNPRTGEAIVIQARKRVSFHAALPLKRIVNK